MIHELYKHQFQILGRETAELRTALIAQSGFRVVDLNVEIAKKAGELRRRCNELPAGVAIIAGTAIQTRSFKAVTDDEHFQVKEIRTKWV